MKNMIHELCSRVVEGSFLKGCGSFHLCVLLWRRVWFQFVPEFHIICLGIIWSEMMTQPVMEKGVGGSMFLGLWVELNSAGRSCAVGKKHLHNLQDHLCPCFRELTSVSLVSFLLKSLRVLSFLSLRVGTSPDLILLGEHVLLAVFSCESKEGFLGNP